MKMRTRIKNMEKVERNGAGSQRGIVSLDAVLKERAPPLLMCHEAGYCNRYVFGIY